MKIITILLAEDHQIVRQGLRVLLESEADMKIVCEAENGRQAVVMAKEHKPEVLLIDIAMPHLNGLETARQILQAKPSSRILILSAHSDIAYLEKAIDLGVAGFLIKQTSASMLAKAIRAVAQGKTFFSPSFSKHLAEYEKGIGGGSSGKNQSKKLTSRESEVLQLIAEGMANKQTASELGISIKTVEKHRQALMDKLGLHDTAGLTRYAIESGVIESSVQSTTD
jgi:DNA-binding NarL/FixJ family response regulator